MRFKEKELIQQLCPIIDETAPIWQRSTRVSIRGRYVFAKDEVPNLKVCYHLHICSHEEVKDGDFYIYDDNLFQAVNGKGFHTTVPDECMKIIATSNSKLHLPMIPPKFIKGYITANTLSYDRVLIGYYYDKLVLTDSNEINIKRYKRIANYTRGEVEELLNKYDSFRDNVSSKDPHFQAKKDGWQNVYLNL